jgi:citrate synthase
MNDAAQLLTAGQAAARLGVKPETLYAYVSRGLLTRSRTASGSFFDPLDIEAFAARRSRGARAGRPGTDPSRAPGQPLMVLDTDIAAIEDDELFYRGRPAADLAKTFSFDSVAAWLWGEQLDESRQLSAPEKYVDRARRLVEAIPSEASWIDRAVIAVRGLAIADPLRDDVGRAALPRAGEIITAALPRTMAPDRSDRSPGTVPAALWQAMTGADPSATQLSAINAAMVLSIDHDLPISTMAARVAASARGSAYSVVTAALGAFDSPLHGTASQNAARLLRDVLGGTPPDIAVRRQLRILGRHVPGFGQPLYRGTDPRAAQLFDAVDALEPALAPAIDGVREVMRPSGLAPNLDLGLAALTVAAGMSDDAGTMIFATARIAGWVAHAMLEYDNTPLRLRPRGHYVGPRPAG